MAKERPVPNAQESRFELEELFFSTTDQRGVIRSGNDVFVRVSGYELPDLLGQPHNIIRHPDMPRVVFKLLWDYLASNRSIVAYVKNLSKSGSYYWVVALVTQFQGGYLSVRFKPSSALFSVIKDVYRELLAVEANFPVNQGAAAMKAAGERLQDILKAHQFEDYTAFMQAVLREELKSRRAQLTVNDFSRMEQAGTIGTVSSTQASQGQLLQRLLSRSAQIEQHLYQLFSTLDAMVKLKQSLHEKADFIGELMNSLQLLALNASVEGTKLGAGGAAVAVLADRLREGSTDISASAAQLTRHFGEAIATIEGVSYDIAAATLQSEMLRVFVSELAQAARSGAESTTRSSSAFNDVQLLTSSATVTTMRALSNLKDVYDKLAKLQVAGEDLGRIMRTLRFVYVSGRIQATHLPADSSFSAILEDVLGSIENTGVQLAELIHAVSEVRVDLGQLDSVDGEISAGISMVAADARELLTAST